MFDSLSFSCDLSFSRKLFLAQPPNLHTQHSLLRLLLPPHSTRLRLPRCRFLVLEPGHDWFAIFFDLIFVGVAFKLGLDLKANLSLYGCFVTSGLVVPLFQTWVRTVKYANLFSGTTDIYTTMFSQAGLTIAAAGVSLVSDIRMGSGYHWGGMTTSSTS
jgi:hypothetical protein